MGVRCIAYCEALYQAHASYQRPLGLGGKAIPSPWTTARAVAALQLWYEEERRMPQHRECCRASGLPSDRQVKRLFGTNAAWARHAGIAEEDALVAAPCAGASDGREVDEAPLSIEGQEGMPPPRTYARRVSCLRCGKEWDSPDARHHRICPACHVDGHSTSYGGGGLASTGEWMNGTVVQDVASLEYAEMYVLDME